MNSLKHPGVHVFQIARESRPLLVNIHEKFIEKNLLIST